MSEQYERALELLRPHRKGSDTLEQTLNRLFKKHLVGRKPHLAANPPYLNCENITVTGETKPKNVFAPLADPNFKKGAYDGGGPIVIVRFRGQDCLIDGNHRGRLWLQQNNSDPHTAVVLVVKEN
jgi:hypothetical protein